MTLQADQATRRLRAADLVDVQRLLDEHPAQVVDPVARKGAAGDGFVTHTAIGIEFRCGRCGAENWPIPCPGCAGPHRGRPERRSGTGGPGRSA